MDFHTFSVDVAVKHFNSNKDSGLSSEILQKNRKIYGLNKLSQKKKSGFFAKLSSALKEPMLIILLISFFIALGANIAKLVTSGGSDFSECFGLLCGIVLSVSICEVVSVVFELLSASLLQPVKRQKTLYARRGKR